MIANHFGVRHQHAEQGSQVLKVFGSRLLAAALMIVMAATSVLAADAKPAKQLFGGIKLPSAQPTESLGFYARGCLAGGVAIPVDGPAWQVIHLSRNRNWGNPQMIALLERLAHEAKAKDNWNGLLVGDISQPRGGPMLTGHASHQIGLDADIWLTPMPNRKLNYQEREVFPENSVLKKDTLYVDGRKWTKSHERLILRAASYSNVERVFVHPGIKKKLCDTVEGRDRSLLSKIRPIYGHHYHFHIRMKCPSGSADCEDQVDPPQDAGCGKPLAEWFDKLKPRPVKKPTKPVKNVKPKELMMTALPKSCALVLRAPSKAQQDMMMATAPDTTVVTANALVAADTPAEGQVVLRSIDEFSTLIPQGPVPIPAVRPVNQ